MGSPNPGSISENDDLNKSSPSAQSIETFDEVSGNKEHQSIKGERQVATAAPPEEQKPIASTNSQKEPKETSSQTTRGKQLEADESMSNSISCT